jgi:hypothetical protein
VFVSAVRMFGQIVITGESFRAKGRRRDGRKE